MKKLFKMAVILVAVVALLCSTVVNAYASNWSGGSSSSGTRVEYGYNESGQYYAKMYSNNSLVLDMRTRGTNLWNATNSVLLSAYEANRSQIDVAIDVNGNVYGVSATTGKFQRFDNGIYYPVTLDGYVAATGTPFQFDTNGFVTGFYTDSGQLLDLSGDVVSENNSNNWWNNSNNSNNGSYGTGQLPPPQFGDGPGSITWGNGNGCDDEDEDYPWFSPTSKSSTTRTIHSTSSLYYKYTISSGSLKFSKNGSSSTSTVSSSYYEGSVVYFSFTEDEEVIMVTKYAGEYYAYLLKLGKTTVSKTIFEESSSYSVTTNDDGFVTKIKSDSKTYSL